MREVIPLISKLGRALFNSMSVGRDHFLASPTAPERKLLFLLVPLTFLYAMLLCLMCMSFCRRLSAVLFSPCILEHLVFFSVFWVIILSLWSRTQIKSLSRHKSYHIISGTNSEHTHTSLCTENRKKYKNTTWFGDTQMAAGTAERKKWSVGIARYHEDVGREQTKAVLHYYDT